ncbi:MAG: IS66 family transposase [Candidatus Thiothrix putei]|uniref:IS66 family transposase n=1 Tax=Candidatus Thiothrix putei TaxID=3080811 RepID=A0AA95KLF8_9GAMM|nr:MAG: IS66 family transposase [Candidatus Thiothrix putei]
MILKPSTPSDTSVPMPPIVAEMLALREENAGLRADNAVLQQAVSELKRQLVWFRQQVFGSKSEKRPVEIPVAQLPLFAPAATPVAAPEGESITVTYQRGKAPKLRPDDCVNDSGLRFTADVPVKVIHLTPPELQGEEADQYEVIGTQVTHRVAQRPASYLILQYERPVIKRKGSASASLSNPPLPSPAPANVLERSVTDVSFLVGMLVDKFQYHLPLYRQHQRLTQAGITLSRTTLTNAVKRAIDLLKPIAEAQLASVLQSKLLAMDETPIKASPTGNGKMKQGYFWPLYGDQDEIVFTFSASRGRQHIEKTLRQQFSGTLLSDGYRAYASYVNANDKITHAQCWVHSRRTFIAAETAEPQAVRQALDTIAALYQHEARINEKKLDGEAKRTYRLTHSKPLVDQFFEWCQTQLQRTDLIPSNPLTKALGYVIRREHELRVFLEDPDVPMDTNHIERALRPIPMGRKNWLFCWTELGAEHVGIIQSLITTCRLHDINPYVYLMDVLLRVSEHPASQVQDLTPRCWKQRFADKPLRSDLFADVNDGLE